MIPYGRQHICQEDIDAVVDVLKSDFLTQGTKVPDFEGSVASYVGASYAVACSSATSGLHLACMALGVGPGDIVWTSPNTFVASANCALYCRATVDFVDIDPVTYNISVDHLREKLELGSKNGRLPKVVIPVHFSGLPCDMHAIHKLSQVYGFRIIEDASHAIGASHRAPDGSERRVGSCFYSDITVFSFHPVKIVTTGEGGVVTTNNPRLAEAIAQLRSHGITRDPAAMTAKDPAPWYYEQRALGYNYRMTDIQASLGLSQMARLPEFLKARELISESYDALLSQLPITLPSKSTNSRSSWHLYPIKLLTNSIKASHRRVFESLREAGIGVNLHYMPVYQQPYFRSLGFNSGYCPNAEGYASAAISLPIYYGLTSEQQLSVCEELSRSLIN